MRVLITGATGFVGTHLSGQLARDGHELHILDRAGSDRSSLSKIAAKFYQVDEDVDLAKIVDTARPEFVFHLSSLFISEHQSKDVSPLIRSNVLFPCQLLEAMARAGVRKLVNCGTSWQHYDDREYSPVCLYAATKQAFQSLLQYYVEADGFSVADMCLFDTYGPNDRRPKLFSVLYKAAQAIDPVPFSPGLQELDLVYIDDVVAALCEAGEALLSSHVHGLQSYAVRTGQPTTLKEVVEVFKAVTGLSPNIAWGERPYRRREMMTPWTGGRVLPHWTPKVSLADGIRRMHMSHVQD
ncbi:MAG: NAD-dependent epimerase/dehydratase family protein [Alphaproteobacteria bacterium]